MSGQPSIDTRKREYLDWTVRAFERLPMKPLDGRAWSLNHARLVLGRDLDEASRYFESVGLTVDKDFMGIRLLKTLLDFGESGRLSPAAVDHLRSIFVDWEMEPINRTARWRPMHTENHDAMMLTIGLFVEQFRGHDIREHVKQLAQWLAWRFERGWIEWNAPRYQHHSFNPLVVVAEHAPSPGLRKGAADLVNLQLAERALLSVNGYLGGPFFRSWDRHPLYRPDGQPVQRGPCAYFDNNRYDAYVPVMWLAFGLAEPRFDYSKAVGLEPAGDGYGCRGDARLNQDEGMFLAASPFVPHPVVCALADEARTRPALVYRGSRSSGWPDDPGWAENTDRAQLVYYNTPHISMGSLQCFNWSHQTRYNNVMFAADPSQNLRIELILDGVVWDRWRHERRGELVQHHNWLLGRGQLVEDGGIESTRVGPWNLYRVGKGLAAHVELDGGYHVLQVGDLDQFRDERAFIDALTPPVREGAFVKGVATNGDRVVADVRDMSVVINGQARPKWTDMLHDSEPMRSVYGSGVVEIRTGDGSVRFVRPSTD